MRTEARRFRGDWGRRSLVPSHRALLSDAIDRLPAHVEKGAWIEPSKRTPTDGADDVVGAMFHVKR